MLKPFPAQQQKIHEARMAALKKQVAQLPAPANEMEAAARRHLINDTACKLRGNCQHWMREIPEELYGDDFEQFRDEEGTAKGSGLLWKKSKFALKDPTKYRPGDIVYWLHGHGPNGHVGIVLQNKLLANNSVLHWDGFDSRGIRALNTIGPPDLAVRIWGVK